MPHRSPQFDARPRRRGLALTPEGIVLTFLTLAVLWILVTDNVPLLNRHQTAKGVLFMLITSGLIYVLLRSAERMREAADRRQRILLQELDHRVRNNLAAIVSIADRTIQTAPAAHADALARFRESFVGRLNAMAALHDLLARDRWEGVRVQALVERALRPYADGDGKDATFTGPDLLLPPRVASAFAMTLHELAANAAKHGAFGRTGGRVDVSVWVEDDPVGAERAVHLKWSEHGVPGLRRPEHEGFGLALIRNLVEYDLGGATRIDFGADGLCCEITAPLVEETSPPGAAEAAPSPLR